MAHLPNIAFCLGGLAGVWLVVYGFLLILRPFPKEAPPGPGPPAGPLPRGTTIVEVLNNEWADGVVFCRGPVDDSLARVFLDEDLTTPAVRSTLDCAVPGSPAALAWGEGVPQGATLAIGLRTGESRRLYIAEDGSWPSGACWFQDAASNRVRSLAKGPMFMSTVEFTIEASGKGAVWFDVSSVEGVSGGITMAYTDWMYRTQTARAVPGTFQGSTLQIVDAPGFGFKTVLSDKNVLRNCACRVWDPSDPECNSESCFAACPGSLVDNPCGQHRCRAFYAKRYRDSTSYCGWLYSQHAQTYCWAMDEWMCIDETCGYGGVAQPSVDCTSPVPLGSAANTYSCGHEANVSSGVPGQRYWTEGPGCRDKMVLGVPTNPAPPRFGGVFQIRFESLPWLHGW